MGTLIQNGTKSIANYIRFYKLGQLLQIEA